jgi:hypothetical protein
MEEIVGELYGEADALIEAIEYGATPVALQKCHASLLALCNKTGTVPRLQEQNAVSLLEQAAEMIAQSIVRLTEGPDQQGNGDFAYKGWAIDNVVQFIRVLMDE